MSTLAEIEAAANTLSPEQLRELLRFLAERVEATNQSFTEPDAAFPPAHAARVAPPSAAPAVPPNP